jgi:hypothetical protein
MKRAKKVSTRAKGGHRRAEALTPERRKEIATKAAVARWSQPRPPPEPRGTICRAEEAGGMMKCTDCGLTWRMDDSNYPTCPRLAGLKVFPPVAMIERQAKNIVFTLVHNGNLADWDEQYPNRIDWQAQVDFVVGEILKACAETA